MTHDDITHPLKALDSKIRTWREQRNTYRLEKINREREQFIETLQKRYGYTKEKAIYELHKNYSKVRHG